MTVAVAWLDEKRQRRWCRAARKRTTTYADHVRTRCGYSITAPVGIDADHEIDCDECLAKEM